MKVLVACEFSGTVRDAFAKQGHYAMSCDLLPTEKPGLHYTGSVFDIIDNGWDLMICHPPCTYLTISGNRWFKPEYKDRYPDRPQQRLDAIAFAVNLFNSNIDKVCMENPAGVLTTQFRPPNQYVQPYQFGEPHAKRTGLWLKNLPLLVPTNIVKPEYYVYKDGTKDPMWHYQSFRYNKEERAKMRSRTFQGIADAMAEQWGKQILL